MDRVDAEWFATWLPVHALHFYYVETKQSCLLCPPSVHGMRVLAFKES